MRLPELLKDLGARVTPSLPDVDVTHVAYDSRRIGPGGVFVCISGLHSDGHQFARDAVSSGAVALVVEKETSVEGAVSVLVPDTRKALALLSCRFHGYPSRKLKVVGITGTNGKTTVSYMVRSICREAGLKAGVIGTIGYDLGDVSLKGPHTTPEAPEFQELMAKMVDLGMTHAAVEVSSHALALSRSYGTEFDVVVFTNLSRDHLDFHGTFEEYKRSKLKLFTREERGVFDKDRPTSVVNLDGQCSQEFVKAAAQNLVTYSMRTEADVRGADVELFPDGSTFSVFWKGEHLRVALSIPGAFNAMNALAAFGVGTALNLEVHQIIRGLQAVRGIPGRLERVEKGQDFSVFVDYAHTPDALGNVLRAVRDITEGRLVCVFGCGGDRDKGKRSEMGRVAGSLADLCVITSDNPRSEDPLGIIASIEKGARQVDAHVTVVPGRREAIEHALRGARTGDSVLVAGKGHENYQILGETIVHFDDREV
ncbi:MAG: UDP-N-acetylmuramoyl-L-alanyl-D-glutamate--2,6-diaminopimelate ligase, partial [Candidatus Eiseniibacteriota bacterium]